MEIRAVAADGRILNRKILASSEPVVSLEFEAEKIEEKPSDEEMEASEEEVSVKSNTVVENAPVTLQIRVRPENAVILIDGSRKGRGSTRVEARLGEPLNLRIESPGYAAYEKRIVITPESQSIDIELEARTIVNRIELPGRGVGTPAYDGRFAVVATIEGVLIALNAEGEPLWVRETEKSRRREYFTGYYRKSRVCHRREGTGGRGSCKRPCTVQKKS